MAMKTDTILTNFPCNAWFAQLREDETDVDHQQLSIVSLQGAHLPDAAGAQTVTEVSDRERQAIAGQQKLDRAVQTNVWPGQLQVK
jgi:hypothetical protein